jgi:hypothetical protein
MCLVMYFFLGFSYSFLLVKKNKIKSPEEFWVTSLCWPISVILDARDIVLTYTSKFIRYIQK